MNNFKEMSLVNRAFLFSMMLLSGTVVCAQDATLAGPTGCGSNGTSGTWIVPCDVVHPLPPVGPTARSEKMFL